MRSNTILFYLFLMLTPIVTNAQDFQLWVGANVQASFTKRFKANYKQEVRLNNNCRQLKVSFSELGLEYGLNNSFSVLGTYRLFFFPKYAKPIHRSTVGLKYRHKWIVNNSAVLGVSARSMYLRKYHIDAYKSASNTFRLKLEFKYRRSLFEPLLFAEGFYAFNPNESYFKRYRLGTGTYVHFTKNQSLGFRYIFQQNYGDKSYFDSALSIGYKFRLSY